MIFFSFHFRLSKTTLNFLIFRYYFILNHKIAKLPILNLNKEVGRRGLPRRRWLLDMQVAFFQLQTFLGVQALLKS